MSQNQQNTIIKTALKYYNPFRRVKNEAIIWLKITTDTGNNLNFENEFK